jgi:hypothetical protein
VPSPVCMMQNRPVLATYRLSVLFDRRLCTYLALQRAHWQAHDGAIASVDLIPARAPRPVAHPSSSNDADAPSSNGGPSTSSGGGPSSSSSSSQVLILTGSRDCNVAVWTLDGGLVGVLGDHLWDLDNQATWQDPTRAAQQPPRFPELREPDDTEVGSLAWQPLLMIGLWLMQPWDWAKLMTWGWAPMTLGGALMTGCRLMQS